MLKPINIGYTRRNLFRQNQRSLVLKKLFLMVEGAEQKLIFCANQIPCATSEQKFICKSIDSLYSVLCY